MADADLLDQAHFSNTGSNFMYSFHLPISPVMFLYFVSMGTYTRTDCIDLLEIDISPLGINDATIFDGKLIQ